MTYLNDIVVDDAMMKFNISYSAAVTLKYINRYVNASRLHGRFDMKGIPYCFASKEKLAEKIHKSKRTVARAIAELKAAGLIESRRTRGLAHIYITCLALDGISGNGKNGTYINNSYKSYNNSDISIYPDKANMEVKTADDAKIADGLEWIAAATSEKVQDNEQGTVKNGETPKKGKPTRRRQRITKAEKNTAKERYRKMIERKLDISNSYYLLPDAEGEYRQLESLVDMLADAMAVPGRQIRVNGAGLSVEQYWQVVQKISISAIDGLFDRLKTAAVCTGITNMRAYTLAAVYNAVQWHELTASANIDLYRHTAG